jgi:hypothetical protein
MEKMPCVCAAVKESSAVLDGVEVWLRNKQKSRRDTGVTE